jgi:hypothetical protein
VIFLRQNSARREAAGFNFFRMTKERTTMNAHQTAPTQFIEAAQRQQKGETET